MSATDFIIGVLSLIGVALIPVGGIIAGVQLICNEDYGSGIMVIGTMLLIVSILIYVVCE